MKILKRKTGGLGLSHTTIALSILVLPIILLLPSILTASIIAIIYIGTIYYWHKHGPINYAACIKNDTLYIKAGMFSVHEIQKSILENIRYETNHYTKIRHIRYYGHRMIVNMKGYEEWEIPIFDKYEHMENLRLYNFISENFFKLEGKNRVRSFILHTPMLISTHGKTTTTRICRRVVSRYFKG